MILNKIRLGYAMKPVNIEFTTDKPITEDKQKEIIAWCDELRKRYPKMKAQRIAKKAIAHFKL